MSPFPPPGPCCRQPPHPKPTPCSFLLPASFQALTPQPPAWPVPSSPIGIILKGCWSFPKPQGLQPALAPTAHARGSPNPSWAGPKGEHVDPPPLASIKMCKANPNSNPNSNPISNPSPSPRACRAPGWEQRGGKAEQLPSLQPQVKLQPYRISDSRGAVGWGRASCAPLPTPSTHAARFGTFSTGMRLNGGCSSSGLGYPHPSWVHGAGRAAALKQGAVGPGSSAGRRSWPGRRGRRPQRGWLGQAPGMSPSTSPSRNLGTALPHPGEHLGCCCSGGRRRAPSLPGGCGTRDAPGCGVTGTPGAAPGCG